MKAGGQILTPGTKHKTRFNTPYIHFERFHCADKAININTMILKLDAREKLLSCFPSCFNKNFYVMLLVNDFNISLQ